eukprot:TRINITY_DN93954_c0_g1_i1.p1 TRINITY_DN93954_c0_g1~~TRINITY_DN93954_c0_g1_i1.p1  ORF type:complete len:259 (-),score=52.66 TRINITY_DN93954_c0_g1_i1:160-936(-)
MAAVAANFWEQERFLAKAHIPPPPGLDLLHPVESSPTLFYQEFENADFHKLLPAKVVPSMSPPRSRFNDALGKKNPSDKALPPVGRSPRIPSDAALPPLGRTLPRRRGDTEAKDDSSSDEDRAGGEAAQQQFFQVLRSGSQAECLEEVCNAYMQVLNKADSRRMTALHYAVRRRMPKVCQALLARPEFEALQAWDDAGDTAMHAAVSQGDEALCHLILAKDPTLALAENSTGETASELALRLGSRPVIRAFQACRSGR